MDITISPGLLAGAVQAIPSKSQAHRILICAAFSDRQTSIHCPQTNQDIEATADCLRALGASITRTDIGYTVQPIVSIPKKAVMDCRESGSTLRFMLPIVGALGVSATFVMAGRLPTRPLSPLWEEMQRMGCTLNRETSNTISCTGQLKPGQYTIDGSVSSQFITGLLFAMALMPSQSQLIITGKIESLPYIQLTQQVLEMFGVHTDGYTVRSSRPFRSPGRITVEGDWSNGAFFLAAACMGSSIYVEGLDYQSTQGDKACDAILQRLPKGFATIDAADIPDLVPILAVAAAAHKGASFLNIGRLRLKESDRVASVIAMLRGFGVEAYSDADTLTVKPGIFSSGVIDAVSDHRIAMAAAIAATVSTGPVTILDAHCVSKSYPSFWDEYCRLGGHYEQYIR